MVSALCKHYHMTPRQVERYPDAGELIRTMNIYKQAVAGMGDTLEEAAGED